MIRSHHHNPKKILKSHIEKLERANREEENAVIAEVAKIKRSHIRRFGRPKPISEIPLNGIVSEHNDTNS
ncbi:MAG: hypothetical protein JWO07_779 [Candidatus Saccharibacteria bacterium]|nr:hypothetical protein [Candidatus Saccharibacteria bacterium]